MVPRILLVNPPVYDFTAYDFWLKPYGMLTVAGYLRCKAELKLFDYLDREHQFLTEKKGLTSDRWGRGKFYSEKISLPNCLSDIPRYFRRFGLPRDLFTEFLQEQNTFDFVFIQTVMTYWYLGVKEVIADVREFLPNAKIILGGNYITIYNEHAKKLAVDFLVLGSNLKPLWEYLNLAPDLNQPSLWEVYKKLKTGILKLSDGCPFNCTYCSVPKVYKGFKARQIDRCLAELDLLCSLGVENIAFYDDALLFNADEVLKPFLKKVKEKDIKVNFHTPNALNARFLTKDLAELMVETGFKTFYLGFESKSTQWQEQTGSKVFSEELAKAVEYLKSAGIESENITAYQILGHPNIGIQQLEESMHFVNSLGVRGTLADFSPIPGTEDGESCRKWVDMNEPLMHNKTAFPIILLGFDEGNRLKDLQRKLNRRIT